MEEAYPAWSEVTRRLSPRRLSFVTVPTHVDEAFVTPLTRRTRSAQSGEKKARRAAARRACGPPACLWGHHPWAGR